MAVNTAFFVQHLYHVDLTPMFTGDPNVFLILKNGHNTKGTLVGRALFGLYYMDSYAEVALLDVVFYFQFGYSHCILSVRLDLDSDINLCVEGDNMNYDVR